MSKNSELSFTFNENMGIDDLNEGIKNICDGDGDNADHFDRVGAYIVAVRDFYKTLADKYNDSEDYFEWMKDYCNDILVLLICNHLNCRGTKKIRYTVKWNDDCDTVHEIETIPEEP